MLTASLAKTINNFAHLCVAERLAALLLLSLKGIAVKLSSPGWPQFQFECGPHVADYREDQVLPGGSGWSGRQPILFVGLDRVSLRGRKPVK